MENKLPKRKPTRMRYFDYSRNGAYFITICTQDRKCLLSSIIKNNDQTIVGDGAIPYKFDNSTLGIYIEKILQ